MGRTSDKEEEDDKHNQMRLDQPLIDFDSEDYVVIYKDYSEGDANEINEADSKDSSDGNY